MSQVVENEEKKDWKTLQDVQSVDDFDLNKIELIRGKTPKDINERCLKLCKDYLSGNWCQQTVHTIEVRRIAGGLTNQLYFCGLKEKSSGDVPQEVVIRLYGPKRLDTCDIEGDKRLSDVIVGLMVSENNFGPKIYGIFQDGQIQKYYQHRQFKENEQKNPKLVKQVFQRLAHIHAMDVPLKRNTNWVFKMVDNDYHKVFEEMQTKQLFDEYKCQTLKNNDLKSEIDWIKCVIERVKSPLVFTHNDYRSSNLLITEPNDQLVVCDFEYSSYGYRGYDLSSLLREWGRNQFDFKSIEGLPPKDSEFKPLIEMYIEECERIYGKSYSQNEINSVDHILIEAKIFFLFFFIITTLMFMKQEETNEDNPLSKKVCMEFADLTLKNYFTIKGILKEQKVID